MKTLLLSVSLLALTSVGALAADLSPQPVEPAPPVVLPFSWTGFYVGAAAGANFLSTKDEIPLYPSSFTVDSTGFAIGGKVGGNYQFDNNIVVGLEASALYVTNSSSHLPGGSNGERYKVGEDYQGNVVARFGYAIDRFLPYIKGGYAFAHLTDLQYSSPGFGSKDAIFNGWTVGGGLDYALTDNIIIGIDYSYSKYSKKHFVYGGPNSLEPTTNTILATISYKF